MVKINKQRYSMTLANYGKDVPVKSKSVPNYSGPKFADGGDTSDPANQKIMLVVCPENNGPIPTYQKRITRRNNIFYRQNKFKEILIKTAKENDIRDVILSNKRNISLKKPKEQITNMIKKFKFLLPKTQDEVNKQKSRRNKQGSFKLNVLSSMSMAVKDKIQKIKHKERSVPFKGQRIKENVRRPGYLRKVIMNERVKRHIKISDDIIRERVNEHAKLPEDSISDFTKERIEPTYERSDDSRNNRIKANYKRSDDFRNNYMKEVVKTNYKRSVDSRNNRIEKSHCYRSDDSFKETVNTNLLGNVSDSFIKGIVKTYTNRCGTSTNDFKQHNVKTNKKRFEDLRRDSNVENNFVDNKIKRVTIPAKQERKENKRHSKFPEKDKHLKVYDRNYVTMQCKEENINHTVEELPKAKLEIINKHLKNDPTFNSALNTVLTKIRFAFRKLLPSCENTEKMVLSCTSRQHPSSYNVYSYKLNLNCPKFLTMRDIDEYEHNYEKNNQNVKNKMSHNTIIEQEYETSLSMKKKLSREIEKYEKSQINENINNVMKKLSSDIKVYKRLSTDIELVDDSKETSAASENDSLTSKGRVSQMSALSFHKYYEQKKLQSMILNDRTNESVVSLYSFDDSFKESHADGSLLQSYEIKKAVLDIYSGFRNDIKLPPLRSEVVLTQYFTATSRFACVNKVPA